MSSVANKNFKLSTNFRIYFSSTCRLYVYLFCHRAFLLSLCHLCFLFLSTHMDGGANLCIHNIHISFVHSKSLSLRISSALSTLEYTLRASASIEKFHSYIILCCFGIVKIIFFSLSLSHFDARPNICVSESVHHNARFIASFRVFLPWKCHTDWRFWYYTAPNVSTSSLSCVCVCGVFLCISPTKKIKINNRKRFE